MQELLFLSFKPLENYKELPRGGKEGERRFRTVGVTCW